MKRAIWVLFVFLRCSKKSLAVLITCFAYWACPALLLLSTKSFVCQQYCSLSSSVFCVVSNFRVAQSGCRSTAFHSLCIHIFILSFPSYSARLWLRMAENRLRNCITIWARKSHLTDISFSALRKDIGTHRFNFTPMRIFWDRLKPTWMYIIKKNDSAENCS